MHSMGIHFQKLTIQGKGIGMEVEVPESLVLPDR